MKKFIVFLGFVLVGTLSTLNSYAECDIQTDTTGNTSDDVLYLQKKDWAGNPEAYGPEKTSYHLKCDSDLGGSSICKDKTQIVITKEAYIGNSFRDLNKISGGSIIKCSTGFNDSWEKVGGINELPTCGNSAPKKYTITVSGKTIHCARKEKRGDNEYCIGTKSGDICVESGKGKSADKPKEEEKKVEEELGQVSCDAGYAFDSTTGECEPNPEEKKEEVKEEKKAEEAKPKSKRQQSKKAAVQKPKENTAAAAAGAGAVAAAAAPAIAANSQYSEEFQTCRAEVGLDIRDIQNGKTGTRYHIKTTADSQIKNQYKAQYGEELDAKAKPSNVETFVLDASTGLYCAQHAPKNESAPAAVPAASSDAEPNNSQDDDLAKQLHAECKQVLDKYNDTKKQLNDKKQ